MNQESTSKEKVQPFFARYLEEQEYPEVKTEVRAGAHTLKYPSDTDELHHTLKYPSDGDEI